MGRRCLDGHSRPTTEFIGHSSCIVTIKIACWLQLTDKGVRWSSNLPPRSLECRGFERGEIDRRQLADSARWFNNVVREVTVVLRSVKS